MQEFQLGKLAVDIGIDFINDSPSLRLGVVSKTSSLKGFGHDKRSGIDCRIGRRPPWRLIDAFIPKSKMNSGYSLVSRILSLSTFPLLSVRVPVLVRVLRVLLKLGRRSPNAYAAQNSTRSGPLGTQNGKTPRTRSPNAATNLRFSLVNTVNMVNNLRLLPVRFGR